jgi:hypothetical protein
MEAFEFVEDSIVCYDTGMPTAKYQDNIEHGKIIQCANMGNTYAAEFKFCSFKLKALKDNASGMVYNSNQKIYDLEYNPIPFAQKNLKVMIGIDCDHSSKTSYTQTASTCVTQGYQAYQQCNVCDALFDTNDQLLAEIIYLPLEQHKGGNATCSAKAICSVCDQEYGSLNQDAHTGTTIIINQKDATKTEEGYTGDKVCSHCLLVLEKGKVIPIGSELGQTGDINININGNNNIVGDNNNIVVYYNTNATVLTVGFLVIGVLLLVIIILLIVLCLKSKKPNKPDDSSDKITSTLTNDSPTHSNASEPVEEIAITNDEGLSSTTTEIVEETTEVQEESDETDEEDGNNFATIVKKPFETKLAEASDLVKQYYNELKSTLLSYKKVKSRLSIKYVSVYVGRQNLAKFVIRGKSLYVYLALDPNNFVNTKYNVSNCDLKTYSATPCKYKVNGERKLLWAKELILELAKAHGLIQN